VDGDNPTVASPYLTAPEAAEYLGTTVQGVYSLVKRGDCTPCRAGLGGCCSPARHWTNT